AHSTRKVCTLLKLNRSNYYRRKQVKPKLYSAKNGDLIQRIRTIFKISGNNYGSRRIQRALALENIYGGRYKIRRIMKMYGLTTTWTRAVIKTTNSNHNMAVAENILDQNFHPTTANQAWVAAITYIQTGSGWLYLAAVMDLYSRK